jgi:hypothetical protein
MKRAEAQDALREMQKSLEKVARLIDSAAHASDPSRNAELMRSLHLAQDQLSAARRALGKASGTAVYLGNQLLALLPADEDKQTVKVA